MGTQKRRRNRSELLKTPIYLYFIFLVAFILYLTYNRADENYQMLIWWTANAILVIGIASWFIVPLIRRHVYNILESMGVRWKAATTSKTIAQFIVEYDQLIDELFSFEKRYKFYVIYLERFTSDVAKNTFQWRLREAIARETAGLLSTMKTEYAYNNEYKRSVYAYFVEEIKKHQHRFVGEETWDLLRESLKKVYKASGSGLSLHDSIFRDTEGSLPSTQRSISKVDNIDGMEGHAFESWCAQLLQKNGFVNVLVTPGSGDQGVDITAVKDGVKYAIQCKNYSGQVGNSAIQEVHAGKSFYDCNVAVVMTNSTFTPSAKALAQKTGVFLWDRSKICELLKSTI